MTSEFLPGVSFRPVRLGTEPHTIGAQLAFGHGDAPLEIVVVRLGAPPSKQQLKSWWKHRKAARPAPLLLVALAQEAASVCGPTGEEPPIYTDLDVAVLAALCREALDQPDRHAALRALRDALPAALSPVIGIRNEGLLATHELQAGARLRPDWDRVWRVKTVRGGCSAPRSGSGPTCASCPANRRLPS